jgi:hypothetical protein
MNSKTITDIYFSIISLSESTSDLLNHENAHSEIDEIKEKISSYFNKDKEMFQI